MGVLAIRESRHGLLAPGYPAAADAPDGRTTAFARPLRPALNVLALLRATLSSGPVLVDSKRCAPFPCGPRPSMKADSLIPQRHSRPSCCQMSASGDKFLRGNMWFRDRARTRTTTPA